MQPLEITRFRLTTPFPLTYTDLTGTWGYQRGATVLEPMTFLARIVRFLFWLLVISWGAWLLRRVFGSLLQNAAIRQQGANASGELQTPNLARRLVRDPVCGMHVDETLSIPMREGDQVLHFCSIACRDAYVVSSKKFAASG